MSVTTDAGDLSLYEGVRACGPTLVGYISIGLAMGIVGAASRLSVLEIGLLAALVYAGAAQFIICALLVQGSPLSVIALTTFIVNLRHLLMSMALAPHFARYSLLKNVGIGTLLTDESFGVAATRVAKGEPINDRWMYGLNVTAYLGWIGACVLGALFGKWIADPKAFGLDFALTAMFAALLVLQLQSLEPGRLKLYLTLVLYTVVLTVVLCTIMPSYAAIILSTVIGATIGAVKDR